MTAWCWIYDDPGLKVYTAKSNPDVNNYLKFSKINTPVLTLKGHDDVIKWKHFPRYWPFVRGIHRSPVNSPHKGQWRGALMFSLVCVWIDGWVNNREAGDLRRYRAHYDVTVMYQYFSAFLDFHHNSLTKGRTKCPHIADGTFKWISCKLYFCVLDKISLNLLI